MLRERPVGRVFVFFKYSGASQEKTGFSSAESQTSESFCPLQQSTQRILLPHKDRKEPCPHLDKEVAQPYLAIPVPSTTLEKYSLFLVSCGGISQCSRLSLRKLLCFSFWKSRKKHDSSEGTQMPFSLLKHACGCVHCDGSKKLISCQPEMPKIEAM